MPTEKKQTFNYIAVIVWIIEFLHICELTQHFH